MAVGQIVNSSYNNVYKGFNSTAIPMYSNANCLTPLQRDTLTFQGTPNAENKPKQGLSTLSKVGIGLGALALVGTCIALISKGKVSEAKKLAEHIEFTPAKTIEEARTFARTHLGIKHYELTNIDVANHVNEGLTNLSNSVKGKTMFSKVKVLPYDNAGRMSCTSDGRELGVNEREIIEAMKLENLQSLFYRVSNKCNFSHFDLGQKQQALITKFKTTPDKLTFNEKMELEELIAKIEVAPENYSKRYIEAMKNDTVFNIMKKNNRIIKPDDFFALPKEEQVKYIEELFSAGYKQPIYARGAFHDINHEFGHKLHAENIGKAKFEQIAVNIHGNSEKAEEAMKEYFKKFIQREPGIYPTLREVSGYAPFSEAEAVAEIFAGLQNGVKYDEKILALFEKWGGVKPNKAL